MGTTARLTGCKDLEANALRLNRRVAHAARRARVHAATESRVLGALIDGIQNFRLDLIECVEKKLD